MHVIIFTVGVIFCCNERATRQLHFYEQDTLGACNTTLVRDSKANKMLCFEYDIGTLAMARLSLNI
jgi:hypothetical protein